MRTGLVNESIVMMLIVYWKGVGVLEGWKEVEFDKWISWLAVNNALLLDIGDERVNYGNCGFRWQQKDKWVNHFIHYKICRRQKMLRDSKPKWKLFWRTYFKEVLPETKFDRNKLWWNVKRYLNILNFLVKSIVIKKTLILLVHYTGLFLNFQHMFTIDLRHLMVIYTVSQLQLL